VIYGLPYDLSVSRIPNAAAAPRLGGDTPEKIVCMYGRQDRSQAYYLDYKPSSAGRVPHSFAFFANEWASTRWFGAGCRPSAAKAVWLRS
jgi:hypothetical protein